MIDKAALEPIPGFPEWSPQEQVAWQGMFDAIRSGFERFGFRPIETPAVERNVILTAKQSGDTTREIYQLGRLNAEEGEADERDYSLHFDLTVPLARYVAQRAGEIAFPFRRYQMQPVWRGERPSAHQGRFRQFYQCDIDIIGDGALAPHYDAEIPAVIHRVFQELAIGDFRIRINNRKIMSGFFAANGIAPDEVGGLMRSIDKIEKQGVDQFRKEMAGRNATAEQTESILAFFQFRGSLAETLAMLKGTAEKFGHAELTQGVAELTETVTLAENFGLTDERFAIDLGIARGLTYYTGTVYETTLLDAPHLGSVCSGGRYDDLAGHFTNRKLPGVGISIGLTRLFTGLVQMGRIKTDRDTIAPVLVARPLAEETHRYARLAQRLRDAGIATELYLEDKKLGKQFQYASRRGFRVAVIVHMDEIANGTVTLKNLVSATQETVPEADFVAAVQKMLAATT